MGKLKYSYNCVGAPDIKELSYIVENGRKIKRETFLKHVDQDDIKDLERALGYGSGIKMKDDWHVSYYSCSYKGSRIYYFVHSAIEFVFTK